MKCDTHLSLPLGPFVQYNNLDSVVFLVGWLKTTGDGLGNTVAWLMGIQQQAPPLTLLRHNHFVNRGILVAQELTNEYKPLH